MKVIYSDWGLGNFYGDYIEINKELRKDKILRDYIVKHELGHTRKSDLHHDFNINLIIMPRLINFIIKHPKTWIDFLPLQYRNKEWIFDRNMLFLYIIGVFAVSASVFLKYKMGL